MISEFICPRQLGEDRRPDYEALRERIDYLPVSKTLRRDLSDAVDVCRRSTVRRPPASSTTDANDLFFCLFFCYTRRVCRRTKRCGSATASIWRGRRRSSNVSRAGNWPPASTRIGAAPTASTPPTSRTTGTSRTVDAAADDDDADAAATSPAAAAACWIRRRSSTCCTASK